MPVQDDIVDNEANASSITPHTIEDGISIEHNATLNQPDKNISIEVNMTESNISRDVTFIYDPHYAQQWYLEKNDIFYMEHNIDTNASIHIGDALQKYAAKG